MQRAPAPPAFSIGRQYSDKVGRAS